jgi:hypothetical protein
MTKPDKFFSKEHIERLSYLMEHWRAAKDSGTALSPVEQTELEMLVDEELKAATNRAATMVRVEAVNPFNRPS